MDVGGAQRGRSLGAQLDQIAAWRGHGDEPGEVVERFVAPTGLMTGTQRAHFTEERTIGLSLRGGLRGFRGDASVIGFFAGLVGFVGRRFGATASRIGSTTLVFLILARRLS